MTPAIHAAAATTHETLADYLRRKIAVEHNRAHWCLDHRDRQQARREAIRLQETLHLLTQQENEP